MMLAYAMWVVAVLILIAGQMAGDLHQSIVEERRATDLATLRAAAISGLEAYRLTILAGAIAEYSHPQETFRRDPALCSFQTAEGVRTVLYHVEQGGSRARSVLAVGARDEESRLNILMADVETVSRLPGVTEAMARNLSAYLTAERAAPPQALSELQALPGWEGLDAGRLRALVTFHGAGQVNLNTAPPQVFRLLGISTYAIRELLEYLSGPNGVRGDTDDRFFKGLSEIEPMLEEYGVEDDTLIEWVEAAQEGLLTVKSEHYRVRARALAETTGEQYEVDAVVRADETGTIVAWREHQPS